MPEVNSIIHADCLDVLREMGDKSVDLVLTDPPYGIGESGGRTAGRNRTGHAFNVKRKLHLPPKRYPVTSDVRPADSTLMEMLRVSTHQIVWGGNYFCAVLGDGPCWLVWDKDNTGDFADCELAWTSFGSAVRRFRWKWNGFWQEDMSRREARHHPTQKPVPLFKWCLSKYSKPGDLVLDPFAGSGTTALACHALGRRYICIEREKEYVDIARNRLRELQAQGDLFIPDGANSSDSGSGPNGAQHTQVSLFDEHSNRV